LEAEGDGTGAPEADASGDAGVGSDVREDGSGEAASNEGLGEAGPGSGPDGLAGGGPSELPADSPSAQDGQARTDLQALPRSLSPQSLSVAAIAPMDGNVYTVGSTGCDYATPADALNDVGDLRTDNNAAWVMELQQSFTLGGTALSIPGGMDVTIRSATGKTWSIDANKQSSVIKVAGSGAKLTLGNIKITGGSASEYAIRIYSDDSATNCALILNDDAEITGNGGGMTVSGTGNTVTMNSGAKITKNIFTSTASGAGVYLSDNATFTMNAGAAITGNETKGSGGGMCIGSTEAKSATFIMNGGEISGNKAGVRGGGLFINFGTGTMKAGAKISGNSVTIATEKYGGGVHLGGKGSTKFTMEGGEISGNSTPGSGGGVYVAAGSSFDMKGGTISSNTANADSTGGGGGVAVISNTTGSSGKATFTMTGGEISSNQSKNTAGRGGGVYVSSEGKDGTAAFVIKGSVKILSNKAMLYGGGIYVVNYDYKDLQLNSGGSIEFSGNTSKSYTALKAADKSSPPWTPAGSVSKLSVAGINEINGLPDTAASNKISALNDYDIGYKGVYAGNITVRYLDESGTKIGNDVTVKVGEGTKYTLAAAPTGAPSDFKWILSKKTDASSVLTISQNGTELKVSGTSTKVAPQSDIDLLLNTSGVSGVVVEFKAPAVEYGITYEGLDGAGVTQPSPKPTKYTTQSSTSVGDPAREGYTFLGWTVAYASNSNWNTTNAKSYSIPASRPGGVALTANWSVRTDIVLNLDANFQGKTGGTTGTAQLTGLTYGKKLSEQTPSKTLPTTGNGAPALVGYTFEGWSTSSGTFTAGTGTNNSANFDNDTLVNWAPSKTVYARWKARTDIVLNFDANGGTAGSVQKWADLTYDKALSTKHSAFPTAGNGAPTRGGYIFKGWSTASGASNTVNFSDISVKADWISKTVYAVWEEAASDPGTTLKVSCAVSGDYANKTIDFNYTITLIGADNNPLTGSLSYTGGGGKANGSLMLASDGSAIFTLRHGDGNGESITINDVPLGGKVKVTQAGAEHYKAKYADNGATGSTPNTETATSGAELTLSERAMSADRAFAFTNTRDTVVPTSVDAGDVPALLIALAFVLIAALYPARWVSRLRAEKIVKRRGL
jgi:uncharacterized repeat protein (TIGR02543 family)